MQSYKEMTASEIQTEVSSGKLKAKEVAIEAIRLAKSEGEELNAFITICEDKALAQADAIDKMTEKERQALPLCGVPVAIKDNISYKDYRTTCGSKMLENYVPPYDATVVIRIIEAGGIIIGKTNMDEFAMGSSNETSFFGPVKNPLDHSLTPGGSSGGAAAAVAQKIVPIAYGSETGGSVRQPAAFCGLLGMKPTYGTISRYGLVAYASSTDQISPFARTHDDLALAFDAVKGHDPREETSLSNDLYHSAGSASSAKPKLGIVRECFAEGLDSEIESNVRLTVAELEKAGHSVQEISMPSLPYAVAAYYVIAPAEASANLARFDGVRFGHRASAPKSLEEIYSLSRSEGFGKEVKRRIMIGTYVLSAGYYDAYYKKATEVREMIRLDFERAFEKVDVLVSPTTPTPPFKLGALLDDPLAMYLSDCYTIPASLAGLPSISVPCGQTTQKLPTAIQFTSAALSESMLISLAASVMGKE